VTAAPYQIQIAPRAHQQILSLTLKQQMNFLKVVDTLSINPRPPGAIRIEGLTGLYCQLVENIKIIYKVEEQTILILLVK